MPRASQGQSLLWQTELCGRGGVVLCWFDSSPSSCNSVSLPPSYWARLVVCNQYRILGYIQSFPDPWPSVNNCLEQWGRVSRPVQLSNWATLSVQVVWGESVKLLSTTGAELIQARQIMGAAMPPDRASEKSGNSGWNQVMVAGLKQRNWWWFPCSEFELFVNFVHLFSFLNHVFNFMKFIFNSSPLKMCSSWSWACQLFIMITNMLTEVKLVQKEQFNQNV